MSEKIIGLDIGSYSIKMLRLQGKFRGFEILDFREKRILPFASPDEGDDSASSDEDFFDEEKTQIAGKIEDDPEEKPEDDSADGDEESAEDMDEPPPKFLAPEVMETLKQIDFADAQVVVALPYNQISSKVVSFPFKDKKKISQVLPFSVEGLIPFDIEDLMLDYQILSRTPQNTRVLVNMVKRDVLKEYLDLLSEVGVDPKVVEFNASSLFNLSFSFLKDHKGVFAFVDIGHEKTSICIVGDQRIQGVRTIPLGGKFITERLAHDLSITFEDAETGKVKYGSLEHQGNSKDQSSSATATDSILRSLNLLASEIKKNLHVHKLETGMEVEDIFLCGGTSKLKNICGYFAKELQIQVRLLSSTDAFLPMTGVLDDPDILISSLGLALRGVSSKHHSDVNFRKDEFLHHEEESELKKSVRLMVVLGVILLGLYFTSLFSEAGYMQERLNTSEQDLHKAFTEILPGVSLKKHNYQQNKAIFETRKAELAKKAKILTGGAGVDVTPLEILKVLSERIPQEVTVNIDELDINTESKKVIIKGRADSFTSVEKIEAGLKQYDKFRNIASKPERDKKKEDVKVRFTIMLGKEKEQAEKLR